MSNDDKKPERDLPPGVTRANGHSPDPGDKPPLPTTASGVQQPNAGTAPNAAQQALVSHCQALLETIIFGTITKFQGVTANVIAISTCRALGVIVGTIFHGSLSDVLTVRRQCREAFLQGLASAPAPHLIAPQPPQAPYVPPVLDYKKVNGQ